MLGVHGDPCSFYAAILHVHHLRTNAHPGCCLIWLERCDLFPDAVEV